MEWVISASKTHVCLDKMQVLRYLHVSGGMRVLMQKEAERLLIKKYRKTIYAPVCRAVEEYGLIEAGDRIAVCVSGGKDSFILALCMRELAAPGEEHWLLDTSLDEVYWPCSHSRAISSFPSQLEWKIGLPWANTRGILNSPL